MNKKSEIVQTEKEIKTIENRSIENANKITVLNTSVGNIQSLNEAIKNNIDDENLVNAINYLYLNKVDKQPKEYGIRWTKSTDIVERLGDAIGLTAITGGQNDFDKLYPWSEIKRCNLDLNGNIVAYYGDVNYIEDGTYQCMVEIPKFWFKMVNVTDDIFECWICDKPKLGYVLHPAFYRCRDKACDDLTGEAIEVNYRYRSSYLCSEVDGKAISKVGILPKTSITIGDSRNLCKANGNGWGLLDYNLFYATQVLYIVEYAHFDSQTKIGLGYINGNDAIITGGTSNLGNRSGSQSNNGTDGKHQVSYRGVEDIWGNCKCWIDGFYYDINRNVLIGNKGFNNNGSGYKSCSTGLNSNSSGYINNIFGNNELGFMAKETKGSDKSKLYDYAYLNSNTILVSGNYLGTLSGMFYFSCFYTMIDKDARISFALAY